MKVFDLVNSLTKVQMMRIVLLALYHYWHSLLKKSFVKALFF